MRRTSCLAVVASALCMSAAVSCTPTSDTPSVAFGSSAPVGRWPATSLGGRHRQQLMAAAARRCQRTPRTLAPLRVGLLRLQLAAAALVSLRLAAAGLARLQLAAAEPARLLP